MTANLMRKLSPKIPVWLQRSMMNLWLPYLGAGIKVMDATPDFRYLKVCLKRRWYNTNYVGTQFGGSIYAMTDPFYMVMLINILGPEYIVWDKGAQVDFKKPGRSTLYAEFRITDELLESVREQTEGGEKYVFDIPVEVVDEEGAIVAMVSKTLYVRRKKKT